ncbi:TonB-dependent receptor [Cytophagaceae bacterium DM2B3-1]|uniref:TonB-dependent receptor n=1 Tax=Xanthocytophaga flava TaxID=3048013 RepID=A0ABT7D0H6_9BACT|nr:TonB-dependent receptor [Xanthocytophaga flavus]MDJ1498667.1 TonB-dependent receptor [Xanthocytophaga flavus]
MKKIAYLVTFLSLLLWTQSVFAQQVTITGVVTGEDNSALPGVSVAIKGTATGSVTDANGKYSLRVPDGATTLVVSFIGMVTQEIAINGRTQIDVKLQADVTSLDEIVVVGYGGVKKSDLTGSVASVETQKITQVATVDVNQALQGKVAGVQITPNSGAPGAASKVRIRGIGSFGDSSPLYVVDGYPTSSIDYISPNDIENMEVLKDASATAIYGNRGANGVVIITTKKGKAGTPTVNVNMYAGIQNPWHTLKLTNAAEYATLYLEAYTNDGKDVTDPEEFNAANYTTLKDAIDKNLKGTDWQKEVIRKNALIQNYNFSITGGSEKSRFGVSGTWFGQDGTVINTAMKKLMLRVNNDYTFNKRINAGWSVAYTNSNFTNYLIDQYAGVLPTAIVASPVTPAWDPTTNNYGVATQFSTGSNPLRLANELKNRNSKQNRIVSTVYGEAELLSGLKFRSNFGGELFYNISDNYSPQFYISPNEQRSQSNLVEERTQGWQWTWSNFFMYNKEIGDHTINASIGTEAQSALSNGTSVTGYDMQNDPSQLYIGSARQTTFSAGSTVGRNTLLSFFGRVNYTYKGKYLITVTGRRDATSRFIQSNRSGFFPSFSLGWNMKEETFLQNVNWLSNLKLRVGYGEVGNQNISNTAIYNTIQTQQRYSFNGIAVDGRAMTTLSNPNLKWERSKMTNVGIDAGFLNDKVNLTLDYFIKRTSDMIVTPAVPAYTGYLAPAMNLGDMENKGLEVALNYVNREHEFKYDLGVNMSFIRNKIVEMGGNYIDGGNINTLGNTTRTQKGNTIASFYGRKTDGIFHNQGEIDSYVHTSANGTTKQIQPDAKPGDIKYVDIDGSGSIDDLDRTYLGSAVPDFTYGFNAFMSYKNFDLKLFFQGTYGNEIVNGLAVFTSNQTGVFNSYQDRMDRWTPENPSGNEPRMSLNAPVHFSDRYVENGSYLRLRNIQLGYTIPEAGLKKLGVKSLRVYVSADNLLTFTKYRGYDPDVSDLWNNPFYSGVDMATYPQARTFIGGINLTF